MKYLFSIVDATLISEYAGELPAGARVHVRYSGGKLATDSDEYKSHWLDPLAACAAKLQASPDKDALERLIALNTPTERATELIKLRDGAVPEPLENFWVGLEGKILQGIDWVLVRKDGVVTFDARVTLNATEGNEGEKNGFLIDALISGAVDLDPSANLTSEDAGASIYYRWKTGGIGRVIPVALAVRFEASGAPPADASQAYQQKAKSFIRYARLTRHQCLGDGTLTLGQGTSTNPLQSLNLKVYEYDATNPQN